MKTIKARHFVYYDYGYCGSELSAWMLFRHGFIEAVAWSQSDDDISNADNWRCWDKASYKKLETITHQWFKTVGDTLHHIRHGCVERFDVCESNEIDWNQLGHTMALILGGHGVAFDDSAVNGVSMNELESLDDQLGRYTTELHLYVENENLFLEY